MKTGRRTFIKTVAAGSAAARETLRAQSSAKSAGQYPKVYTGRQLRMIAFPLGGIGAGTLSLGGRGDLRDWEIFNKADKGRHPQYGFASIWAQSPGQKPVALVLESQLLPPFEGPVGLGSDNVPGLPRLASATFTGEYPVARIDFADPRLPVSVQLEAFTPFIPRDADASGLPVAILRYRAKNPAGHPVSVSIGFAIDNPVGGPGRTNTYRATPGLSGLLYTNPFLPATDVMSGSFAVAVIPVDGEKGVSYVRGWRQVSTWPVGPLLFWDRFSADGTPGPEGEQRSTVGTLAFKQEIPPGGSADFTFLLAWHFPNRTPGRCGARAAPGDENTVVGNFYCSRFKDAWEAAQFAASHLTEYEARTRSFVEAMRRTTLPAAVREAAMANLSTLVSQTSMRTQDERFYGFEGCNDSSGCCEGSCTHVWNYESATAHVFPSLSQSLRETSFLFDTDENGLMSFREWLPFGKKRWGFAAADGQMGQIMHLYLDWRLSGDTPWLRTLWPAAKRALEFAWITGGWDSNRDGVMEGAQHNTYDVEFFGPNPLCGVWYLGALRAGEEIARAVGDTQAAATYRSLFEKGSQWIDANLFNGEYYIQKVQGMPRDQVAKGLLIGMGAGNTERPDLQMGEGCLIDQLAGQYFAHLCGLGLLLNEDHIRKTLQSIYRYNYKRRLDQHESVQRIYALNDEAGMVICDYGKAKRPEVPFPYFAELMTGFEYAAAILMMYHGMANEGAECIANIRRRYDGERRNPWNEAECGYHYARAMASWGAIPALSGFNYHGAESVLRIAPRWDAPKDKDFESFWSTGTAWGSFIHRAGPHPRLTLTVREGVLACRAVELTWSGAARAIKNDGAGVDFQLQDSRLHFSGEIKIRPGTDLTITGTS